jgi:hypothetical protein
MLSDNQYAHISVDKVAIVTAFRRGLPRVANRATLSGRPRRVQTIH